MEGTADQSRVSPRAFGTEPRDDLVFELARAEHDEILRRLLRENPIPGWVSLSFEREPSYCLATTIEGDNQTVLAREAASGRVVGMFSRSVHDAYLNGQVERLGYLGQLRVDRAHRGRFSRLQQGYEACRRLRRDGEAPFDLTSVVESNHRVRRILAGNLPGMPTYRALEAFSTLVLPCQSERQTRYAGRFVIERGKESRLAEIAHHLQQCYSRYQCAPYWTEEALKSNRCRGLRAEDFFLASSGESIHGCLALWDQSAFKQSVVRGYEPRLALLRPVLNAIAPLISVPKLPPVSASLRAAYLSHVAVNDPEVLVLLLRAALCEASRRRYACLILGFSSRNPLLQIVKRQFRCLEYRSILYLVHWPEGEQAARVLDHRIAHVEVATL